MSELVALTGATGFIGQHLLAGFRERGTPLRVLARNPARVGPLPPGSETLRGCVTDPGTLRRLVAGADSVVHCAGSVRGVTRAQFDRVNADATGTLAEAAAAAGVARFLLISSLAAREPRLSAYAASKRAGEERVLAAAGGMGVNVFRPPAVYGPGDTEMLSLFRLMGRGIAPVFGRPGARFSLIYAGDLAAAILAWVEADPPPAGTWEPDDGRAGGYDWDTLCAIVSGITGRPVRRITVPRPLLDLPAALNWAAGRLGAYAPMLTPGKLRELRHPDWVCDPGRSRFPGWEPQVDLREGLLRTPGWRP